MWKTLRGFLYIPLCLRPIGQQVYKCLVTQGILNSPKPRDCNQPRRVTLCLVYIDPLALSPPVGRPETDVFSSRKKCRLQRRRPERNRQPKVRKTRDSVTPKKNLKSYCSTNRVAISHIINGPIKSSLPKTACIVNVHQQSAR